MRSNLNLVIEVNHSHNIPSAQALADLTSKLLTRALNNDPVLSVVARLDGAAIEAVRLAPPVGIDRDTKVYLHYVGIEHERMSNRHKRHVDLQRDCGYCVAEAAPQYDRLTGSEED